MGDWITTECVADGDWWLSFSPEMLDLIRFHTRREPQPVIPCRVFSIENERFVRLPNRYRVKLSARDFVRAQWRRRLADEQVPEPPAPSVVERRK